MQLDDSKRAHPHLARKLLLERSRPRLPGSPPGHVDARRAGPLGHNPAAPGSGPCAADPVQLPIAALSRLPCKTCAAATSRGAGDDPEPAGRGSGRFGSLPGSLRNCPQFGAIASSGSSKTTKAAQGPARGSAPAAWVVCELPAIFSHGQARAGTNSNLLRSAMQNDIWHFC